MNEFTPLYKQLYNSIVDDILSGRLRDGEKLPSKREMSQMQSVSSFTVDATYKLLIDTGFAVSKPRQGVFVIGSRDGHKFTNPWATEGESRYSFSPNGIDAENTFDDYLEKIYQSVLQTRKEKYLDYGEKGGESELRIAISDFLYKFKKIDTPPENIIIGASTDYLLTSLMRILNDDTVYAMGDHDKSYHTFNMFNRKVAYFPITENGIDTSKLDTLDADIIYVIPSNQFPLCSPMSEEQRHALLNWAYAKDNRYIIEDGYCNDFSQENTGSLYSLDTKGKVMYMDSFSKTIAPTFRLAYIILPERFMPLWKEKHGFYYPMVSILEQLVIAQYISEGRYQRKLKQLRTLYNEKQCILFDAIRGMHGYSEIIKTAPSKGGLHLLMNVEKNINENTLRDTAFSGGVRINRLSAWERTNSSLIPKNIFMLGFGDIRKSDIIPGILCLNEAWKNLF